MPLEVQVIKRPPNAVQFWDIVERVLPRVLRPVAARMQARAPRGKSGKLSRRIDVVIRRVNAGLIQGVEALFVTGVPYGHLVERGHRIVARGPTRKGRRLSRVERRDLRRALLRRRLQASGFTPGTHFADQTLQEERGAVVQGIESGLTQEIARAV